MVKKTSIALILAVFLTAGTVYANETETRPAASSETETLPAASAETEARSAASAETEAQPASADEQSENLWLTDPELMFRICRSDLEGLGEIDGKIYVFGHKSPDTDTVCSSIVYANLLKKLGYDAEAFIQEPVNHETEFVLKEAGVEVPPVLEDASGKNVILIDHSDYAQSAQGLEDANIISIIDHHNAGTVSSGSQLIYDTRPFGSTATIIWIRYMNYGVPFDEQTATLMLGALLSDTSNMKSSATTADREAYKAFSKLSHIDDVDAFYDKMYRETLNYDGMTDTEIFNMDVKEYESGGKKFLIGVVNAYDEEQARDLAERMKAILPDEAKAAGVDMAFAQVSIYHDDLSFCYLVPSDEAAGEVVKQAFGDEGKYDGTSYVFNPGFSRRKVLVPKLSDALAMHPAE